MTSYRVRLSPDPSLVVPTGKRWNVPECRDGACTRRGSRWTEPASADRAAVHLTGATGNRLAGGPGRSTDPGGDRGVNRAAAGGVGLRARATGGPGVGLPGLSPAGRLAGGGGPVRTAGLPRPAVL